MDKCFCGLKSKVCWFFFSKIRRLRHSLMKRSKNTQAFVTYSLCPKCSDVLFCNYFTVNYPDLSFPSNFL